MASPAGGDILPGGSLARTGHQHRSAKPRRPPRCRVATIREESGVETPDCPSAPPCSTHRQEPDTTTPHHSPAQALASFDAAPDPGPQDFSLPLAALLDLLAAEDDTCPSPGDEGQALSTLTPCRSYSEFHLSADGGVAAGNTSRDSRGARGDTSTELDLSTSLAALLSILSVDSAESDTAHSQALTSPWPGMHPSRSLEHGQQTQHWEHPCTSAPSSLPLQRQSSLDSSLPQGLPTVLHHHRPSPASPLASLRSSPMASRDSSPMSSPSHAKFSSSLRSPSPVLTRRMTGHRDTVMDECWRSGSFVGRTGNDSEGLKSVSDIIAEQGAAAFYRGFSPRLQSPMHLVKRAKRN